MKIEKRAEIIKNWINDYCEDASFSPKSLVIGISGGIDSSVVSTLCALTGRRTIVLSMPIKQISSIDFSSGWIKKTLTLVSNNNFIEFKFINKKEEIEIFQKDVETMRDKVDSSNNNLYVKEDSIPDQIKKLSELKDLGILSEEEFTSKKQELLNKM